MAVKEILIFTDPSRCSPCRALDSKLEGVLFEIPATKITVGAASTQEEKDKQKKYSIMSIPTLIFVDEEDNQIGRISGFSPDIQKTIENKINELK